MENINKKRDCLVEQARNDVVDYGKRTGIERLVMLDAKTGQMLEAGNGDTDTLILTDTMMALIEDANNSILLIHNHPGGRSFSKEDIRVASRPGVHHIEAIGDDGSWYKMKPNINDYFDLGIKFSVAQNEVIYFLSKVVDSKKIKLDAADQIFHHIINLALAKIGIIEYEYQLSIEQEKLFSNLEIEINQIIDKAVKKLKIPTLIK